MSKKFDIVVYSPKSTKYTRKTSDLCSVELDYGINGDPENFIQIAAGEFKSAENDMKTKYSYYDNHIITVYQKGKKIFEGTFEQLCEKVHEKVISDTLPNPVRYYEDGQPYVLIEGVEITNHPIVGKLAEYDRFEKYILPYLQSKLDDLQAKQNAIVHCRECKNRCRNNWCFVWGTELHDNEFCSFGRRKNGKGKNKLSGKKIRRIKNDNE